MQHPRNFSYLVVSSFTSVLGCSLLGLTASPSFAQVPGSAPPKTHAVHFWAAGRIVPLNIAAQTDGRETYVPLTALEVIGAKFRLVSNAAAVRVTGKNRREEDISVVQLKGIIMLPLSSIARVVDGVVESPATDGGGKPDSQKPEIVYLLARVTSARFDNGAIRVSASFPVPFHTRMLAESRPPRGFVDCVGAKVADNFRPGPLPYGEKQMLRIRSGQTTPTTARIVFELADGAELRTGDSDQGLSEVAVTTTSRPAVAISNNSPRAGQGSLMPPVPTPLTNNVAGRTGRADSAGRAPQNTDRGDRSQDPGPEELAALAARGRSQNEPPAVAANPPQAKPLAKPVAQPIEVSGLNIASDSPSVMRFDVATGSKVRPVVRYSPGTTQMLVDIPNAQLNLHDGEAAERSLSHPLISGLRMETLQGPGAPMTRITLDTARVLGYSLNVQQGSFSLELRLPRNATGVLSDKVIVVDAGHGGAASGATGGGVCEKNCTLGIAMKLRAELEALGARVVMTRTKDVDVSLTDRSRMGNEIGADLFVSIHNDSNERSNSASGTSTYYHASEPSSRALATCVQQSVMSVTGLPSRGVLSDKVMYNSGFAVLRGSAMPAVLCEVAYINNQNDRRKLCDPQFQQRVAKAICDGLRTYVEGSPRRTGSTSARPIPDPMPLDAGDRVSGARGS